MHEIFEAVLHDFGTEFLDNERTEAAKEAYISTIFSIAEAVEWRKKEFNE